MKRLILLYCLLLVSFAGITQFTDSTHHFIHYAATGIINKTNDTRSYLLSNTLQYRVRKKNKSLNFNSGYVYGKQQGLKSNDDFAGTLDFNLYPRDSSKLYYWGLLTYDKSFSLNIVSRIQAGIGVAYNFLNTEEAALNVSDGFLYENHNLKITDTSFEKKNLVRNSFRLRFRFVISKIIVVSGMNLVQNALDDREDYIVKLDNAIDLKLRSWLSFRLGFSYNRNNVTSRDNMLITLGLAADKYF